MVKQNLIETFQKIGPPLIALALLSGTIITLTLFILSKISLNYCLLFAVSDIAFLLYYIGEKKTNHTITSNHTNINPQYTQTPSKIGRFLDLIYIGLTICILCMLQISDVRPIGYFILMSILAGSVAVSILMGYDKPWKSLGKIFPLSLIATFSVFKVYQWVGYDTWTHAITNKLISLMGTLDFLHEKGLSESVQHVAVAITDILLGADIRLATFMAVSVPLLIVASLAVYIIVKKLTNQKSALLATLLFIYLPPVISWAQVGQTTTYGFLLVVLLLLTYTIWKNTEVKYNKCLFILLLTIEFCLIATHIFSAFIGFWIILALYAGSAIRDNKLLTEEFPLFILYGVFLAIYWIFTGVLQSTVLSVAMSSLQFSERTAVPVDIERNINIIPPSAIESVANMSFLFVLVVCILLICLILTKRHQIFPKNIWIYLSIAITLTLCYCASTLVLAEMAERFNSHCAFLLAILFGCVLFWYQKKVSNKRGFRIYTVVVVLLIVSIGFLGLGNTTINPDNPIWLSSTNGGSGSTIAECDALQTVVAYLPDLSANTYDHLLSPVYGYYSFFQMMNDMKVIPKNLYYTPTYLNWFELPESGKDNLLFRTKVLTRPTSLVVKYGDEFGERLSVSVQLTQEYANQLDGSYSKTYSNGALELIPLNKNFGAYS